MNTLILSISELNQAPLVLVHILMSDHSVKTQLIQQ